MAYDGTLKFDTKIDSSGFQTGLNEIKSSAEQGLGVVSSILNGAADKMAAIGGTMTKSITVPLAGIGAAVIKSGTDFESGMSEVQAISGATGADLEKLTGKAKEMGAKTKYSASESAEAFKYMAMAGWKTGDMLNGIEGIMNLAAASGEDLASTSDIVTDALTAFGLQASDSGHFADVLAAASSNANTDVAMLGESFKYVAPVAGALGYSVEDTSVALGLMANSGIKASQAGTSLRSILTRMVKPTDSSAQAMDALGLSVTRSDGTMKSLDEIMGDLRRSFSGLTEAEKAEMAALLGGQEAMSGLLAIVNSSDKDFNKLKESIYGATDETTGYSAAAEMAATKMDNLQGDVQLFKSALEGLGLSIYEIITPALRSIVQGATEIVNWLNRLDDGTKKIIVTTAGIATAIGPLLIAAAKVIKFCTSVGSAVKTIISVIKGVPAVVGVLSSAFSGIGAIASSVGGAIASIGSTIVSGIGTVIATLGGPLTLAIAAAIAAIIAIICNWDAVKEFFTKTLPDWWMNTVVPIFGKFLDGVKTIFTEKLPALISDIAGWFAELPAKIGEFFADIISKAAEWIAGMAGKAMELGSAFIDKVVEFFTGLPGRIWEFLTGVIGKVGEWIAGMAAKAAEFGAAFADKVVEFFTDLPCKAGYFLGTVIGTVASWILDMGAKAVELGVAFIDKIVEFFTQLPGKIWDFLVAVVTKVGEWTYQMAEKAAETGRNFLEKIVEFFTQLPGKVWEFLVSAVSKVAEWVAQMAQKAIEAGSAFLGKIVEFFSQLPGKVWEFLSNVVAKVAEWLVQMIAKAAEAGSGFLAKIVEFFSELPYEIGYFLGTVIGNIAEWAGQMAAKAAEAGKSFLENVIAFFVELPGKIWDFLADVVSKVAEWAGQLKDKGVAAAKALVKTVVDGVKELPGKMLEVGKNVVEGVWKGICKAKDAFIRKVKEFFSGIVDGVKDTLKIGSPSKVMADEIGQWIPPGIGEGFEDAMPALEKQVDAEMSSLVGRMQAAVQMETKGFAVKAQETARHKAELEYPKGGDTYVEEKIEQTNNYHVPVATPSEVNKANRAAARKLLGGVT